MKEDLLEKVYLAVNEGYVGGKAKILPAERSLYNDIFWSADNFVDELLFYKLGIPNICSYTPFVFCRKEDFESVGGFDEGLVAIEGIQLLRKLRKRDRLKFIKDSHVDTSSRRAEQDGKFYGGFWVPFYHFFFPRSERFPYRDVR